MIIDLLIMESYLRPYTTQKSVSYACQITSTMMLSAGPEMKNAFMHITWIAWSSGSWNTMNVQCVEGTFWNLRRATSKGMIFQSSARTRCVYYLLDDFNHQWNMPLLETNHSALIVWVSLCQWSWNCSYLQILRRGCSRFKWTGDISSTTLRLAHSLQQIQPKFDRPFGMVLPLQLQL